MTERVSCLRWCIVHCLVPSFAVHVEHSHACRSTNNTPPHTMSPSSHLVHIFLKSKPFRVFVTAPWARVVILSIAKGVVGVAHQLAVARAARCAPFSHFVFAVLTSLRTEVEFIQLARKVFADVYAGDIFRTQDGFVHIALNLGEVFLLGLTIHQLRKMVSSDSFLFF